MRECPRPPLGVVLAGGRSRRLGIDKTRLEVRREGASLTLVEWAARRLEPWCEAVVVAGPASLADGGRRAVADALAPGPAGGILGAAREAPRRALLVLACDLPWLPAEALGRLAAPRESAVDLALFRSAGGLEPLCALWRTRALDLLAARCAAGDPSLWAIVEEEGIACTVLEGEALGAEAFFNLNRPQDLERFLAREGPDSKTAD
ncbi:MAG TPA: molybdenum cofactor guanylyltransferase [Thermoanaerobaculia bacterium]|nr:molybdenum cofactor guanylyltransferase [Thermoanaerobaculia bacterium]